MDTNVVVISGRLTADPELKYSKTGTAYCNFRIACNRDKEKADFFNATCFKGTAEAVAQHLTKGNQCVITGRLQVRSWEDKDGKRQYATDIMANQVQFIGQGKGKDDDQEAEQ